MPPDYRRHTALLAIAIFLALILLLLAMS